MTSSGPISADCERKNSRPTGRLSDKSITLSDTENVTRKPESIDRNVRQDCRLFVGCLPYATDAGLLRQFFNAFLTENGITSDDVDDDENAVIAVTEPVTACLVKPTDRYGFIDFRTSRLCTDALAVLDKVWFKGQRLQVRRPSSFLLGDDFFKLVPDSGLPTPNKLYISNLTIQVTERDLFKLLTSHGQLKTFNVVRHPSTVTRKKSRCFAFCEYANVNGSGNDVVTDNAIKALHGSKFDGRALSVVRASTRSSSGEAKLPPLQNSRTTLKKGRKNVTRHSSTGLNGNRTISQLPTKVLRFESVVKDSDDDDMIERCSIMDEVELVCAVYGPIASITIPVRVPRDPATVIATANEQPLTGEKTPSVSAADAKGDTMSGLFLISPTTNSLEIEFDTKLLSKADASTNAVGYVFVEYAAAIHCETARRLTEGSKFDGRLTRSVFYDENAYKKIVEDQAKHHKATTRWYDVQQQQQQPRQVQPTRRYLQQLQCQQQPQKKRMKLDVTVAAAAAVAPTSASGSVSSSTTEQRLSVDEFDKAAACETEDGEEVGCRLISNLEELDGVTN